MRFESSDKQWILISWLWCFIANYKEVEITTLFYFLFFLPCWLSYQKKKKKNAVRRLHSRDLKWREISTVPEKSKLKRRAADFLLAKSMVLHMQVCRNVVHLMHLAECSKYHSGGANKFWFLYVIILLLTRSVLIHLKRSLCWFLYKRWFDSIAFMV